MVDQNTLRCSSTLMRMTSIEDFPPIAQPRQDHVQPAEAQGPMALLRRITQGFTRREDEFAFRRGRCRHRIGDDEECAEDSGATEKMEQYARVFGRIDQMKQFRQSCYHGEERNR